MNISGNIGERFDAWALRQPTEPALIVPGRPTLTYGDLRAQIRSIGGQLRQWGCRSDDIVAAVITDRTAMALACASVCASVTFAPLHPNLRCEAYVGLLRRLRPKAVLLFCDAAHPAREAVAGLRLPVVELRFEKGLLVGALDAVDTSAVATKPVGPRDARWAYVLASSGTSGDSKLVPITHERMLRNAAVLAARFELEPVDIGCHIMPMHLPQGLRVALMVPLLCGSSMVVLPENDAEGFFDALDRHGITWVTAGFTLVRHLAQRSGDFARSLAKSRLRFVRCGSGTLHPDTIRFVEERLRAPMIAAYSAVETGAISIDPLPPRMRKPGGVGVPVHDAVRVIDSGGTPCAGTPGEIVVAGPMVFEGYFDDPSRTEQAIRDGWYHTGDLGYLDRDGYLFITGRVTEVINRGGERILPVEIDAVLEQTPGVKEAAAFALPHPTLGEELFAAVVCADGAELSATAIRSRLFTIMGRRGTPRRVFFVDRLPRTGNGKIKRFELARQFDALECHTDSASSAPAGPLAAALQGMWTCLLSAPHVGANDDFFMLGGDSLIGARLLAQVKEVFGVSLTLDALFNECATVNGMGRAITAARLHEANPEHG